HGTGTKLGDPIEIAALKESFAKYSPKKRFCAIGSVKSNIGHTAAAAGIASFIKVLLSLKHRMIPPSLNFSKTNRRIDFKNSPFYLNTDLKKWEPPKGSLRRAAISSFGFSGTNCHLVVQEAPQETSSRDPIETTKQIFLISAKNEAALKSYAGKINTFLGKLRLEPIRLEDIAYTLQTGREAMEERLAIVASSIAQLKDGLDRFLQGNPNDNALFRGNRKKASHESKILLDGTIGEEIKQLIVKSGELEKLAQLWISGVDIDWSFLHGKLKPKRISLPTYPFAKKRYWIPVKPSESKVEIRDLKTERSLPVSSIESEFIPPTTKLEEFHYLPQWTEMKFKEYRPSTNTNVLILHQDDSLGLDSSIAGLYSEQSVLRIKFSRQSGIGSVSSWDIQVDEPEAIQEVIGDISKKIDPQSGFDIYFLNGIQAPGNRKETVAALDQTQEVGLISLFRLVKALSKWNFSRRELRLKIIVNNVLEVSNSDPTRPDFAGLMGFAKVVANEYPEWKVSCVDLDLTTDIRYLSPVEKKKIMQHLISESPENVESIVRGGKRYVRKLMKSNLPAISKSMLKKKGVYLILGGIGDVGLALSDYLATHLQASLALVGRRTPNRIHRQKLQKIEAKGARTLYVKADAADLESLKSAISQAKSEFGFINGVFHSAVSQSMDLLHKMSEKNFRQAIASKIQGSVNLGEVLRNEPLDFLLFFSSIQSFTGDKRFAHYCAGSHFVDALALSLNKTMSFPVHVINWGYWQLGAQAEKIEQGRLKAMGFDTFTPQMGIETIERLLANHIPQIVAVKAGKSNLKEMGLVNEQTHDVMQSTIPSLESIIKPVKTLVNANKSDLEKLSYFKHAIADTEKFAAFMLLNTFRKMGVFKNGNEIYEMENLCRRLKINDRYQRMFRALLDILVKNRLVVQEGTQIACGPNLETDYVKQTLAALDQQRRKLQRQYPELSASIELMKECVTAYPEVLSGRKHYTEVMFAPGSRLVENVYKGSSTVDLYNNIVAQIAKVYTDKLLQYDSQKKVRILEIGAGTGATTALVLEAIKHQATKLEYDFTDIASNFVLKAKDRYTEYAFVECKTLDIEQDPVSQGFEAHAYDVIIATNVVHATRRIDSTLNRIKKILKNNGLLILNESVKSEDFITLSFGLTEGWWLYEDEERRISGSPLLSLKNWKVALAENGFLSVQSINPADIAEEELGQTVLIGENDGELKVEVKSFVKKPSGKKSDVSQEINAVIADVLKKEPPQIEDSSTFTDLGVDSILAV
ncbi:MAG: SDR family NAD(P)-dependent oxidoreductase, partial [Desulfobacteraceae bacterium]